jgi:hypothetical protein
MWIVQVTDKQSCEKNVIFELEFNITHPIQGHKTLEWIVHTILQYLYILYCTMMQCISPKWSEVQPLPTGICLSSPNITNTLLTQVVVTHTTLNI